MQAIQFTQPFNDWFDGVIQKWEGGVSNRSKDADPAGLTVHGVTIATWKNGGAKLLGQQPTPEDLLNLDWNGAKKIAYVLFWNKNNVSSVKNPNAQPIVADSLWLGGGLRSLGANSISDLNNQNLSISDLINKRLSYLSKLKNYPQNETGWKNRLQSLLDVASKNESPIGLLILILIAFVYVYNR